MTEETKPENPTAATISPKPKNPTMATIRPATEVFYDLQKLRIATKNRFAPKAAHAPAALDDDTEFLKTMGKKLAALETEALSHTKRRLRKIPIYKEWLKDQRGVGPTMAAVILSAFDIHHADTASKFWAYAGLDTMPDPNNPDRRIGRRRVKGQKITYNPWLKTKLVGVLADCFIKCAVWDDKQQCYVARTKPIPTEQVWRRLYDGYKHRKQTQSVPVCMACGGTGKIKKEVCGNCHGTGGPAPWGRSDAHRAAAAKRYMIKMFLLELYKKWRELEGLPVRAPYREAVLGLPPHRGSQARPYA